MTMYLCKWITHRAYERARSLHIYFCKFRRHVISLFAFRYSYSLNSSVRDILEPILVESEGNSILLLRFVWLKSKSQLWSTAALRVVSWDDNRNEFRAVVNGNRHLLLQKSFCLEYISTRAYESKAHEKRNYWKWNSVHRKFCIPALYST